MIIKGNIDGKRVSSKTLEEQIQKAVKDGAQELTIVADGQHGIGGRIWPQFGKVQITIEGTSGQRVGSMGMDNTRIVVKGSTSDDTGWLNCGVVITVLGDVANGAHNAAAQGKLYVQGGGGARCDTMTKKNPRFPDLESWYFRGVGDSFAEFKAGGIAVVCGVESRDPENILGYRPCVGMVGGTIYFRGPIKEYSKADVRLADLSEQDWAWLTTNMKPYLTAIDRLSRYEELTKDINAWKKLIAFTPAEKTKAKGKLKMGLTDFRLKKWARAACSARTSPMTVQCFPISRTVKNAVGCRSGKMISTCLPAPTPVRRASRRIVGRRSSGRGERPRLSRSCSSTARSRQRSAARSARTFA